MITILLSDSRCSASSRWSRSWPFSWRLRTTPYSKKTPKGFASNYTSYTHITRLLFSPQDAACTRSALIGFFFKFIFFTFWKINGKNNYNLTVGRLRVFLFTFKFCCLNRNRRSEFYSSVCDSFGPT